MRKIRPLRGFVIGTSRAEVRPPVPIERLSRSGLTARGNHTATGGVDLLARTTAGTRPIRALTDDDGLLRPVGPMERLPDDHRSRRRGRHIAAVASVVPAVVVAVAAAAAVVVVAEVETATITVVAARIMLVATVVSMWALSAMAVTVRHGRSRMARWAQQQHNDMQLPGHAPPSTPVATAINPVVGGGGHLPDPGGGGGRPSRPSLVPGGDGQEHHNREKANALLRIVESQQQLGDNCTAGTDLNMGEGVVDRYAQVPKFWFS